MRAFIALGTLLALSACAIRQDIAPVTFAPTASREICIVEHTPTRTTFRDAYQQALQERGFSARIVPANSALNVCPVTTTYVARWSWDFTIYMAYAEMRVYHDGRQAGRALYDSRMGGMRLDKWVDAEAKVREMVDQLYADGA
jgi:hypothetical protein